MPINAPQTNLQYVSAEQLKRECLERKETLLWLDLELTGLDLSKDKIVEVAVIASNITLNQFCKGPDIIVNPELDREYNLELSEWCVQTFSANHLDVEILKSQTSFKKAENEICEFIKSITADDKNHTWYLAGSSVHVDRQFLCQEMPNLINLLSYRIIDVTSLATLAWRWCPKIMRRFKDAEKYKGKGRAETRDEAFLSALGLAKKAVDIDQKKSTDSTVDHRAQHDIVQSIQLLRFIKQNVFRI